MKVALVCSYGGHLTELQSLSEAFDGHDVFFVTYGNARTRELDERKYLTDSIDTDPLCMLKAFYRVGRIFTTERSSVVVALPFKIVPASVPISLFDAMSVGTPVVSTRVAGIPELVDSERQLIEPGDLSALTTALNRFVADVGLRESVGSRTRRRMPEYQRWGESRAQFRALLEGCA